MDRIISFVLGAMFVVSVTITVIKVSRLLGHRSTSNPDVYMDIKNGDVGSDSVHLGHSVFVHDTAVFDSMNKANNGIIVLGIGQKEPMFR